MNKNEYYRFGSNLNANIAIDEEKAKNGDVDAMVRLAMYFRTGETIAFDYQTEEDVVGLWIEYEDEDGIAHTELKFAEEYQANNTVWEKGKVYAQMAADKGDVRGFYQNHFYILESVSRDPCYDKLLKLQDELRTYTSDVLVRIEEGDESKYSAVVEFDDGLFRYITAEEIDNAHKRLEPQIRGLECAVEKIRETATVAALDNLLKSAESQYVPAQVAIAKYYLRGKSFTDNSNTPNQDDFDQAEKWCLRAIANEEDNTDAIMLIGELYLNQDNKNRDEQKALDYYSKINAWHSYVQAPISIETRTKHIESIIINNSDIFEGLINELAYLSLSEQKYVAQYLSSQGFIKFVVDLYDRLLVTKISQIDLDGNIQEKVMVYDDETIEFAYHSLKELAEQGHSYAQYTLGTRFDQFSVGEQEIGFCFCREQYTREECKAIAKSWLMKSYENGYKEALFELLLFHQDVDVEEHEVTEENLQKYKEFLFLTANSKIDDGDYKVAADYLKKLMCISHTVIYGGMLLEAYEALNDGSAEEFIINFLDWSINNQINNEEDFFYGDFVVDDLIPRLLDGKSNYYDPAYAIRILQSKEFSSPHGSYVLGCLFSDGEHIEKNIKAAVSYFKQAASAGIGEAYYKLAYLYYYGEGHLNVELLKAKECFEKAIFCGINCEYAYEMVRADLKEKDKENPMKAYADLVISETPRGAKRNARFQDDIANEFGEYWEKLNEKTRRFIYSGIKTYVYNYEDDDPIFDFSAAITPMAKSLETLLGDIFYTKYKQWLHVNGVSNIKEYFESLGVRVSSDKDPFELGVFKFIAYERTAVNTGYDTTRKLIRANKLPAIIRKSGKVIYNLQLHEKFAEYANEIFKEDAFSSDERMQEITAFIINLVSQVEVIREDLRNRASHDTVMDAMHAEYCGNILYKTKKLLYSLISKIKD